MGSKAAPVGIAVAPGRDDELGESVEKLEGREDKFGLALHVRFGELIDDRVLTRPLQAIVEWGTGGGLNAVQLAPEASRYFGVDISALSLRECARQVEAGGSGQFIPVLIDAENPELRNFLGKGLFEMGRHEEAAKHLGKAIELDPMQATPYYNLAVIEDILEKTDAAIEHYNKYIELNPMAPKLESVKQRIAELKEKAG